MTNTCKIWLIIFYYVALIIGVALFGSSFGIVPLNTVALYKNKVSAAIDTSSIYWPGNYFYTV